VWLKSGPSAELERAKQQAKKLGVLVSASDLSQFQVPDGENAWNDLDQVRHFLYEENAGEKPWKDLVALMSPVSSGSFVKRGEKALANWEPALTHARSAAAKSRYFPNCDWVKGVAMLRPELASDKMLARALVLESRVAYLKGDFEKASESLATATKIAGLLRSDKTCVGQLVAIAIENIVSKECVCQAGNAPATYRVSLERILSTFPEIPSPREAFKFETVVFVESVRMVSEESNSGNDLRASLLPGDKVTGALKLPADRARDFELLAIDAAKRCVQGLNGDLSDYEANDRALQEMVDLPKAWVPLGFPQGFADLYWSLSEEWHPCTEWFIQSVRREAFKTALAIASGSLKLVDGQMLKSALTSDATIKYSGQPANFVLTLNVERLEPTKLSFEIVR
jgi:hypothetical protein